MKNWFVYIVECSDGSYYCGMTSDIDKRVKTHNEGNGAKYTMSRLSVKLLASKGVTTKGAALSLEYKVKQQKKELKIEFLLNYK